MRVCVFVCLCACVCVRRMGDSGGKRECELQSTEQREGGSSVEAQLAESVAGQISWQSV